MAASEAGQIWRAERGGAHRRRANRVRVKCPIGYAAAVQSPHDRFFRRIFSDPENAAGELRTILPTEIVRQIDWSTLCLSKSTYVDDELSERRADVLLSAWLGGRPVFLYLLLEHQSTSPPLMAFRLLGYMARIWEDWLADNPSARRLPPILATVVHHSDQGWSAPLSMAELYDLDPNLLELLRRYLPSFEFRLSASRHCRRFGAIFSRSATPSPTTCERWLAGWGHEPRKPS